MLLTEHKFKSTGRLTVRESGKIHHTNTKQMIAGALILMSNKIDRRHY